MQQRPSYSRQGARRGCGFEELVVQAHGDGGWRMHEEKHIQEIKDSFPQCWGLVRGVEPSSMCAPSITMSYLSPLPLYANTCINMWTNIV
jgi:hypothetical protein